MHNHAFFILRAGFVEEPDAVTDWTLNLCLLSLVGWAF